MPKNKVELSGEESRCYLGLKNYYVKIECKDEAEASKRAWEDLQREFARLQKHECPS